MGFFGLTLLAWLAKVGAVSRDEVEAAVVAPALLLEVVVEVDSRDEPRTEAGPLAAERVARTGVDRPEDEEAAEEEEGAMLLQSQQMTYRRRPASLTSLSDADGDDLQRVEGDKYARSSNQLARDQHRRFQSPHFTRLGPISLCHHGDPGRRADSYVNAYLMLFMTVVKCRLNLWRNIPSKRTPLVLYP